MATAEAADMPSMKLQIVVDKKKNRVVFAEANKDFVDFIFHFLTLPLGAVKRLIDTPSILSSIGSMREGLKNLDAEYIEEPGKQYLLDAVKAPFLGKLNGLLLPETSCPVPPTFYRCRYRESSIFLELCSCNNCRLYNDDKRCNLEGTLLDCAAVVGCKKGYVKELVTFMVLDDLTVRPVTATSVFSVMRQLSIKDVDATEKREVTFGKKQAISLLKASLTASNTVLTDVFLVGGAVKAEK